MSESGHGGAASAVGGSGGAGAASGAAGMKAVGGAAGVGGATGVGGSTFAGSAGVAGEGGTAGTGATGGTLDCGPSIKSGGTLDHPEVRSVEFSNIPLENVVAGPNGFHIGVDLSLGDYVPGHHTDDPFYGANVMANVGPISYYHVENPGSFPLGIFINNTTASQSSRPPASSPLPCATS